MALAGSAIPDRQPSPATLSLNLSSNNPFRKHAASPSPRSAEGPVNKFPMASTNPFLDNSEWSASGARPAAKSNNNAALPEDIFSDLSLLDKSISNGPPPPRNGPPPRTGAMPVQGHRPRGSDDRREKSRAPQRGPQSPVKRDARPRRASESSVMERDRRPREEKDRSQRPDRTESEERRRRERRRQREERHRQDKDKAKKPSRRPQGLDIIDKLDVTGIYGQGLFHHDGPFDACNPHRNAKKSRHAPMQAFPEGSANMALGGSGPLRTRLDLDKFHGRGEEGFSEYAAARKAAPTVVDPTARMEPMHGPETYGLGTSTFLEGAPASKSALQRRDSDEPTDMASGAGGLSRKKSLAQRFRGMSNPRKPGPGDLRSPEARYQTGNDEYSPPPLKATSAGGPARARYTKENEVNPFDNDYEAAFDKKGTQIRVAEEEKAFTTGRPRAPSSPKAGGLVRTRTADADNGVRQNSNEEDRPSAGGFLNRMKSLKGGRRQRNEA